MALIFGKQKLSLIETARAFVDKLSKDTVVSRASKTLEAEIDCMEKGRRHADIINSKVLNWVICLVQQAHLKGADKSLSWVQNLEASVIEIVKVSHVKLDPSTNKPSSTTDQTNLDRHQKNV